MTKKEFILWHKKKIHVDEPGHPNPFLCSVSELQMIKRIEAAIAGDMRAYDSMIFIPGPPVRLIRVSDFLRYFDALWRTIYEITDPAIALPYPEITNWNILNTLRDYDGVKAYIIDEQLACSGLSLI